MNLPYSLSKIGRLGAGAAACAVFAAVLLAHSSAYAEPPHMGPSEGIYAAGGLSTAMAIHTEADFGATLGGELSLVYLRHNLRWCGAYADLVRDFGSDRTRFSAGPEFGIAFLGIDGGYVGEFSDGDIRHGIALRPMFTAGLLGIYLRGEHFCGHSERSAGEIGLLLKWPLRIAKIKG